jgi:hypothetical protein
VAHVGSRRGHLALATAVIAAAAGASGAWGAPLLVLIRHSPNMTSSNRTAKTIDAIVIHSTEGRFVGSVRFLERARTRGSAHFVVSRRGQVVQLVPVTDVAWHAGNSWWNLHAIGIEHEGWAGRGGFTIAEYRASAKLAAYLAHRWGIPVDRKHIIGHYEVPNPNHRGRFGGSSGHTDPGRYWNWKSYMWLVRWYSTHPVLPDFVKRMTLHDSSPPPLRRAALPQLARRAVVKRAVVKRAVVQRGATLRGTALWWSGIDAARRWRRHIYKVDFLVDGKVRYTDNTWPYSFHRTAGWSSRTVANGRHMLSVLAYGTRHYRTRKRVPVRVVNPPPQVDLTGAAAGSTVRGLLTLGVHIDERVERVALYVDGKPVSRDSSRPYALRWDTSSVGDGDHRLVVYARGEHGRRGALSVAVVVANSATFPPALADDWFTPQVAREG